MERGSTYAQAVRSVRATAAAMPEWVWTTMNPYARLVCRIDFETLTGNA
jgi:hypothetical protein